jgi:hypothetical protein
MSDIDTVIEGSRVLEQLLEIRLGAKGRGLHQKINSIGTNILPARTIKRLRWIATMRNKVVHEDFSLPDRRAFISSCEFCRSEILKIPTNKNGVVNKVMFKLKYFFKRFIFILATGSIIILILNHFLLVS